MGLTPSTTCGLAIAIHKKKGSAKQDRKALESATEIQAHTVETKANTTPLRQHEVSNADLEAVFVRDDSRRENLVSMADLVSVFFRNDGWRVDFAIDAEQEPVFAFVD